MLEGENNFYVERSTPWGETSVRKYRKDFFDPLDGSGKSGLTIDFTKVTMYSIEFSWYGAIGANFFVYVPTGAGNSKWVKIASLPASNMYSKPALSSPNLRLFTELYIPMGCTQPQLLSLYGSSVYIDGNFRDTLKYVNVNSENKIIDQRDRTQISMQLPNTIQGIVSKPVNNTVVYPTKLTGIATQPTTIDIYETINQGGIDINTAFYLTGSNISTAITDIVKLDTPIFKNGVSFVIDTAPYTQAQKLDLMRRMAGSTFIYRNPADTWNSSIYNAAGVARLSGAITMHPGIVTQLSSTNTSTKVNITVARVDNNGFMPFFAAYDTFTPYSVPPAPALYPAIPLNVGTLYPAGSTFQIGTNIDNNRSFIIVETPVKSGLISFDTDILQFYGGGDISRLFNSGFGILDNTSYRKLKDTDYFKDNITTLSTGVQIASTSPKSELIANSQFAYYTGTGMGGSTPNPGLGWPRIPPFFVNNSWVAGASGLPRSNGPYGDFTALAVNPFVRNLRNKTNIVTRFETSNFTVNIDIRHHNYIFVCKNAVVSNTDATHTYIRSTFTPQTLFSIEDGVTTNNLYNFKLLMYGHNALMRNMFYNRVARPLDKEWSNNNVKIMPFTLGIGTDVTMIDSEIEEGGSMNATLGFPTSATAAIAAFLAKPTFQIEFKTIFLRDVAYRPGSSTWWQDRNTGLFHGTFFIDTIEPVHLFVLTRSRTSFTNSPPQTLLRSTSAIPRPMVTNIQINNGRNENDVPIEKLTLSTHGVIRYTQMSSQDYGIITSLPENTFVFQDIPGSNTQYDTGTTEFLNVLNKVKKYSLIIPADRPFEYSLTSIYGPSKNLLVPNTFSILNRDYKRFFIAARTTRNESFSDWVKTSSITILPFNEFSPFNTPDAPRLNVDSTTTSTREVYIQKRLPSTALSDRYFITSIYAKTLTPTLCAGRYVIFEIKTGESNVNSRPVRLFFDIIDNKIGFLDCRGSGATSCQWYNRYNNQAANNLIWPYIDNTRWFSVTGYANLNNKLDRYVVAAHIQDVGEGWKRLSSCTYYKNNHVDTTIYLGDYTNSRTTSGSVSLYGYSEEMIPNDSTIEALSGWLPAPYTPVQKGYLTLNLTTGEQQ